MSPDGATDFGDHDVRAVSLQIRTAHLEDTTLDLVGDVRDDLNGVAEVLAAAFLGDDRRVNLAGGGRSPGRRGHGRGTARSVRRRGSVSAPSSVTKTSPCWKGFMVPGSTLR